MPRMARPPEMWSSVVASFADERGLPERVGADHQADPDLGRRLRPGRDRQPALVVRAVRVADDRIQVIPRPERVVAEVVGPDARREQARPFRVLVPAERADLDLAHGPPPSSNPGAARVPIGDRRRRTIAPFRGLLTPRQRRSEVRDDPHRPRGPSPGGAGPGVPRRVRAAGRRGGDLGVGRHARPVRADAARRRLSPDPRRRHERPLRLVRLSAAVADGRLERLRVLRVHVRRQRRRARGGQQALGPALAGPDRRDRRLVADRGPARAADALRADRRRSTSTGCRATRLPRPGRTPGRRATGLGRSTSSRSWAPIRRSRTSPTCTRP